MGAVLKNIDRNGERWLLLVFYALIVTTIAMEVIRRFGLSYSSIWGEEIARYAFIYLAWIGASAAIRERAHIRIDVILHYVGPRTKAAIYLFGDFATLTLALIALYWSLEPILTSLKFGSVTHGLRISNAWFLAAVPIGFAMMVFRLVQSILRDWSDLRAGRPVFEGEKLFD
jgi:TRAP-type C4-dicarboxylate transport system permease small subunit